MNNLADRLRSAEIEVERLNFEAIQTSLSTYVEEISLTVLPDLIRLAHRRRPKASKFFPSFQAPFRERDPTLLLDGEDELGSALASASLSQLFETKAHDPISVVAAMLIGSAAFLGWNAKAPRLPGEAASHLATAGEVVRKRRKAVSITLAYKGFDNALKEIEAATQANQVPTIGKHLIDALQSLQDGARGFKESVVKATSALDANQRGADEELDVYWWVASGYSHTLEGPLSKAPKSAVPILVGVELAELVKVLPGPPAAPAYLATALRSAKLRATGAPLKESISALPDSVSVEVPEALSTHVEFAPIAFAVMRQREAGNHTWTSAFATTTGLDPNQNVRPRELATQAYNEKLLARAIGELDG